VVAALSTSGTPLYYGARNSGLLGYNRTVIPWV